MTSIYEQPLRSGGDTSEQGAFVASTQTMANKRQRHGAFSEAREQHFAPAHMRSTVVIVICFFLMVLIMVGLWAALGDQDVFMRAAAAGSMFVAALSFFLAGNTFRLRDIRRRMGNRARAGLIAPIDALSELPPRDTIQRRFLLGAVGAGVGAVSLVVITVLTGSPTPAVSIAPAMLCFLFGTFARPID